MTVGSGLAPDLLTLPCGRRSRARSSRCIPPVGSFTLP